MSDIIDIKTARAAKLGANPDGPYADIFRDWATMEHERKMLRRNMQTLAKVIGEKSMTQIVIEELALFEYPKDQS